MNELLFVLVATVCNSAGNCDLHVIDHNLSRDDCRASIGALSPKQSKVLRDIGGQLVVLECIEEDVE